MDATVSLMGILRLQAVSNVNLVLLEMFLWRQQNVPPG